MCWNKEISLLSFVFIVICCIALINYETDDITTKQNKIIGYYLLFVGLMQLIDYFIWIDLKCIKGINKLAGYLGPLLNYLQPVVLLILLLYFTNNFKIESLVEKIIVGITILYFITVMYIYFFKYLKTGKICSTVNNKHLSWSWTNYIWKILYFPVSLLVIYLFYHYNYSLIPAILSYVLLFISMILFKQNIAELWCFFVIILPIMEIIRQSI